MTKIRYTFELFTFFIVLFTCQTINGSNIDSLKSALQNTHNIDEQTEIYYLLAKHYLPTDINKSSETSLVALDLSQKSNSNQQLALIYSLLGDIAIVRDSMDKAKGYYELALNVYEQQNNISGMTTIVTVLGNIAFEKDNLSDALMYYQRGIALAKESNNTKYLERLNFNIGSLLASSGQYIESQEYFLQAVDAFIERGDSLELARAYANLGDTYFNIDDLKTSREYYNMALNIYQKHRGAISVASIYASLSSIEYRYNNHKKALQLLNKSLSLINQNFSASFEGPKSSTLTSVYLEFGKNYLALNNIDSAFYFLNKGFKTGVFNRQLEETSNATESLTNLWQLKQNADSALFYHLLFKAYSDSLHNQQNNRKLAFQEAKYAYEQMAEKEAIQRQRDTEKHFQNIVILIITIVFLALLLVLLVLQLRLSRTRMKKIEFEQQTLRTELELKNKELTTYLIYQVKNNEFILNISEKLRTLSWKGTTENKTTLNEIIREIETDASADNWDEFIIRFHQVHTDFYSNLGKRFPELTTNDLRLCAFLKLNMNTKDIAAITYQSTKSISVARWRLRQKLGLKKEERLSAFLSQF